MVDVVGDVQAEAPVVGAVLEQVHDGHRSVGESMDEKRLEESLAVVERPAGGCDVDHIGVGLLGGPGSVQKSWTSIRQEVHDQRSSVFDEENCFPPDLRSEIFQDDLLT